MENIIQEFINTSNDIIAVYKRSRVPKYFKDRKLNTNRKLLEEDIHKLFDNNSSIPVKVITDYARVLTEQFRPFGSYNHCRRSIKAGPSAAVCIFEFETETDKKVVVSFDPANEDGSSCTINYSYIINGKPVLSFTDSDVKIIYNYKTFNIETQVIDIIKSTTAECIIEDITNFLQSIIYKEV